MPIYEYTCPFCGSFTVLRAIQDRNLPARCPGCDSKAGRVIGVPNLNLMSTPLRAAFTRNEKSCHEPGIAAHHCGPGCDHGPSASARAKSTRTIDLGTAGKFEAPKKKRPWMLGH